MPKYKNKIGQMPDPKCSLVWPDFVETILSGNGASEYGPRGTRSVPRGAPMGRHEGAELLTAQKTGVPNVTLRSAPWGRPRGRLGTLRLGKQREYAFCPCQHLYRPLLKSTLFSFRKEKSEILRAPWGTPPKSPCESHVWRPLSLSWTSL